MAKKHTRRIHLEVPFAENEAAKHFGAHWDRMAKAWYIPVGQDPVPLLKRWPKLTVDPTWDRPMQSPNNAYSADGKLVAAQVMGRMGGMAGGSKGGKARAETLSPERRSEIASMGAQARNKKRAAERATKILQARERREALLDTSPIRPIARLVDDEEEDRPEASEIDEDDDWIRPIARLVD